MDDMTPVSAADGQFEHPQQLMRPSGLRRPDAVSRPGSVAWLLAGLALATTARAWIGSPAPAASVPAAVAGAAVLAAVFLGAPATLGRVTWGGAGLGVGTGVALVAVSLIGVPWIELAPRAPAGTLLWWIPLVTVVVVTEEVVIRGALYAAVACRRGEVLAVAFTAAVFAVIHVPLYGVAALPVDLAVGVLLGALRAASGGVGAPVLAHLLADVATGWLP